MELACRASILALDKRGLAEIRSQLTSLPCAAMHTEGILRSTCGGRPSFYELLNAAFRRVGLHPHRSLGSAFFGPTLFAI
jgi:hypothetical protein